MCGSARLLLLSDHLSQATNTPGSHRWSLSTGFTVQASNYLNKLAESSRDNEEKKNKAQFKTKWRSLISIQLQRNLAKVIADKLYSIHRMNTTVANY